jgi:hypothetical protein
MFHSGLKLSEITCLIEPVVKHQQQQVVQKKTALRYKQFKNIAHYDLLLQGTHAFETEAAIEEAFRNGLLTKDSMFFFRHKDHERMQCNPNIPVIEACFFVKSKNIFFECQKQHLSQIFETCTPQQYPDRYIISKQKQDKRRRKKTKLE